MELLTIAQAATIAGVSRKTVHNWIREGRIPVAARTASGRVRLKPCDALQPQVDVVEFAADAQPVIAAPPLKPRLCPSCWNGRGYVERTRRATPAGLVFWCRSCSKRWRMKSSA
jgi:excisionase family DNA binding protein